MKFLHSLAGHLKIGTVRELCERMDSAELTRWMAYYRLDPWGEERIERMLALIAAAILNQWRGKGESAVDPHDLIPDYGGQRNAAVDQDELTRKLLAWARTAGADVKGAAGGEYR